MADLEPLTTSSDPRASRRRFLQYGGASVLGLAIAACTAGSSGSGSGAGGTASPAGSGTATGATAAGSVSTAAPAPLVAETALTAADFDALRTCLLLPEKTAGPFPLEQQLVRRDITEGYEGHPVRLGLRVVDEACTPVPGAAVEIWHADATGDYSAFVDGGGGKDEGPGSTFLRGTQVANDEGIVEFLTIFPGWYRGRAVHIHLRVHEPSGSSETVDETLVLTSQLFFDEAYTAGVYAHAPYAAFGLPDTSNAEDAIAGDPEREGTLLSSVAAPTARGEGTLALVNLGVTPRSG